MNDPRKDEALRVRILSARPVRPVMCGLVPLGDIAKVLDPTTVNTVWDLAVGVASLVGADEAHCDVASLKDTTAEWESAEMLVGPALILTKLILDQLVLNQFESVIFERNNE